eukprot:2948873-Pleurochrysis_carterae.AAC.1
MRSKDRNCASELSRSALRCAAPAADLYASNMLRRCCAPSEHPHRRRLFRRAHRRPRPTVDGVLGSCFNNGAEAALRCARCVASVAHNEGPLQTLERERARLRT